MKRFKEINGDFKFQCIIDDQEGYLAHLKQLDDQIKILYTAIDLLGKAESEGEKIKEGSHGYISISLDEFFDAMFKLDVLLANDSDYKHNELRYRPCSVIEAGCGIGRNIYLLTLTDRFLFSSVRGFDIIEKYIQIGRKYFGLEKKLFVDDCWKVDYSTYDVVIFYRPFSDIVLQTEFEKKVAISMKKGAYLVSFLPLNFESDQIITNMDDNHGIIWKRI